jgi:hypothetical protein
MRTWLLIAVAIAAQGCSDDDAHTQFLREFEAGADCSRLFDLRNEARQSASAAIQEEMNAQLRTVQCFGSTSTRASTEPPRAGSFTVQEYRLYRDILSAPSSVSEAQAIENAAQKHGIPAAVARDAVMRVQNELVTNGWFATPDAEIRHASDWTGEKQ